jgi:hypothetical protein
MKTICVVCGIGLVCGSLFTSIADETEALNEYNELLIENKITPTAEGIIKHLVETSPTEEALNNVDELIRQLGASSFSERKAAQKKLEAMGALAENKVMAATQSDDPEISHRARQMVTRIQSNDAASLLLVCLNALKVMNAKDAIPAILGTAPLCSKPYLKHAADEALMALAQPGDMDALDKALTHRHLATRTLAINAYGKLVGAESSDKLYRYLKAPDPNMRLAAAKAIANLGDRKAIPAFLELMADDNVDIRSSSAILLRQFTKHQLTFSAFDDRDARADALVSWRTWLAEKGETVQLHFPLKAFGAASYLNGHTLIAMGNGAMGVVELDQQKKEVWRYGLSNCWTAEKLANGNYLIGSNRSSPGLIEITPAKKIVWEYATPAMGAVQLRNGNILVATHHQNSVIEIRKKDKEVVWRYDANANCHKAYRLPNGNTLIAGRKFIREVTPKKEVAWEYANGDFFYGIQPLPNGNIMVSDHGNGVYELNRQKKKVWEHNVPQTTGAFKLPNGNVLISCSNELIEVNPKKETVWRYSESRYGSARQ